MHRVAILAALVLAGCSPSGEHLLAVDVRTDLSQLAEMDTVRVTLDGEESVFDVDRRGDYIAGQRVTEFEMVPAGTHHLIVALEDNGEAVLSREIIVDLRVDSVVTAVLPRDCLDSGCSACENGVCVPEECTPETPERCPPPVCATNEDCVPLASCFAPVCSFGTCLQAGACGMSEYCNPGTGVCDLACSQCGDPSFGDEGVVRIDIGGPFPNNFTLRAAIETGDGSIVAVGRVGTATDSDFALFRLEADGTPRLEFGDQGLARIDRGAEEVAHSVFERADGDLVFCGQSDERAAIGRIRGDGSPMPSFGTDGVTLVDEAPGTDLANAVFELADGRFAAVGQGDWEGTGGFDMQLMVLLASGARDPSVGTNGVLHRDLSGGTDGDDFATASMDPMGGLITHGSSFQRGTGHDCAVMRFAPDMSIDPLFDPRLYDIDSVTNRCFAMVQVASGMAMAGYAKLPSGWALTVRRVDASGIAIPSFGVGGLFQVDLGCNTQAHGILELPDGRFVVAANGCPDGGENSHLILFLAANGQSYESLMLDTGGVGGAESLTLDSEGRILVLGSATSGGTSAITISRVLP